MRDMGIGDLEWVDRKGVEKENKTLVTERCENIKKSVNK